MVHWYGGHRGLVGLFVNNKFMRCQGSVVRISVFPLFSQGHTPLTSIAMQIYICETTRENAGAATRDGSTGRGIRNGYEKRLGLLRKKRLNG